MWLWANEHHVGGPSSQHRHTVRWVETHGCVAITLVSLSFSQSCWRGEPRPQRQRDEIAWWAGDGAAALRQFHDRHWLASSR